MNLNQRPTRAIVSRNHDLLDASTAAVFFTDSAGAIRGGRSCGGVEKASESEAKKSLGILSV